MIADPLKKTVHLVRLMHAARALAEVPSDAFAQRVFARPVLGYFHEFMRWAPRNVKPLRGDPARRAPVREIDDRLRQLRRADWPDYEPLRHQLAVHRQSFLPEDGASGLAQIDAASRAWMELDQAAVHILTDDAAEVYNLIAVELGGDLVETPIGLVPEVAADVTAVLPERKDGMRVDTGSFGDSVLDTVTVSAGGQVSERLRQIVDVCRSLQLFSRVALVLGGGVAPLPAIVALNAMYVDTCTLADLVYGRDLPTEHSVKPLLSILAEENQASPGYWILRAAKQRLDTQALADVKDLRDKIHGHIDDELTWDRYWELICQPVPSTFDAVHGNLIDALNLAVVHDIRFWPIKLIDANMSDFARVDQPATARPYRA